MWVVTAAPPSPGGSDLGSDLDNDPDPLSGWTLSPLVLAGGNVSFPDNDSLLHNCSNDYCIPDEDYLNMMEKYVFPTTYEWLLISLHAAVFFIGLVGNALVCAAVYRNPGMRTVTNYFLVNLAVADFLVILLCLPPTVLWDVTETWFMGMALCKIVLYFQTVSVAVSVLTLTFISVERWYAICFPLQFRSTISRAKRAIVFIWAVALLFDLPELVVLRTEQKDLKVDSVLLTQCIAGWGRQSDMIFQYIKSAFLYTLPLVFMSIAYCQIARVLWDEEHFPVHQPVTSYGCGRGRALGRAPGRGRGRGGVGPGGGWQVSAEGQVRSRRKAAKMLVAVVALFAICYLPVHLLSIIRYSTYIPQTEATVAWSMISHWLCYANSALNPLIYNFMSEKFRKEFRRTFGCRWWRRNVSRKWSRRRSSGQALATGAGGTGAGPGAGPGTPHATRTVIVQLGRNSQVECVPLVPLPAARGLRAPRSELHNGSHTTELDSSRC